MTSKRKEIAREASHAGSWYTDSGKELNEQLDTWLRAAGTPTHGPARAIIAPHAGYSYSGPTAAFAYKEIDPSSVRRVFILGPSHHVRLSGCALSPCKTYKTPIGDLLIDQKIYDELYETGEFDTMSLKADEDEHSIEMHLPYIAKVMESQLGNFTIVPILVGSLSNENEKRYGQLLAKYLIDTENVFVVSSDFCHWGSRFHYTFYEKSWGDIYESIDKLDHMGMDIIETISPGDFSSYLKRYGNTICGRHPIAVLLNVSNPTTIALSIVVAVDINPPFAQAAAEIRRKFSETIGSSENDPLSLKFVKYAQSSQCKSQHDSSVSYASASLKFLQEIPQIN